MKTASRIVLLLVVGMLAFCGWLAAANAQTTCPKKPTCDPQTTKDRRECGAELKGSTGTGQWRAWWFPVTKTATTWEWCPFKWAMLDKYAPSDPRAIIAVVDALKDAPDVPQAIMDAMTTKSINPPVGSVDAYEFALLHYQACQALQATPPTTWTPGAGPKPCVAPTPPVPQAWVAVGGSIFTSNGIALTSVTTRKATAGASCLATVAPIVLTGGKTYYPLNGGSPSERTQCQPGTTP